MKTKSVILIDDDVDDIEIFKECLRQVDSRLQCIGFEYAEDALRLIKNELIEVPDYIFIDINMPRLSGEKCLADLRKIENLSATSIVMCSTSMPENMSKKLLANGASFTIQKPMVINEYVRLLENIVLNS